MKADPIANALSRREAGSARIARYQVDDDGQARIARHCWAGVLAFFHCLDGGALDVIEFLRRGDYLNDRTAFVQLANALPPATLEKAVAIARFATASRS